MITCSIFDKVVYDAMEFVGRDADFITNGVVHLTDFALSSPATPNMTMNVAAGIAWVDGYRIKYDASPVVMLAFQAANPTNPRIDIVEVGHTGSGLSGAGVIQVVTGTPGAVPLQPQPDAGFVPLFTVRVNAGVAQIVSANVTDLRTGISVAGATTTPLATTPPVVTSPGATGNAGTSPTAAHGDHHHGAPATWPPAAHASTHEWGPDALNGLVPGGIDTGTANNYAVTLTPALAAYTDLFALAVKIAHTNTGASTLAVDGLAAYPILVQGNATAPGVLVAGSIYTFRYNATTRNFILQGEGGGQPHGSQVYTAPGAFVIPAGVNQVIAIPIGGGGGGGGGASIGGDASGGGGSGGVALTILDVAPGQEINIDSIGVGGTGGAIGSPGQNGTSSQISGSGIPTVVGGGGYGGGIADDFLLGGAPGATQNATFSAGSYGGTSESPAHPIGGVGAPAQFGYGGGGAGGNTYPSTAGTDGAPGAVIILW